MKRSFLHTLTSVLLVLPIVLVAGDFRENHIEDNRSKEVSWKLPYSVFWCGGCAINECKVMGMQRYSEPRCEPLGGLGSPCRMLQEPENKTLHYPKAILFCNDVYMQFCPCGPGLVCKGAQCEYRRASKDQEETLTEYELQN